MEDIGTAVEVIERPTVSIGIDHLNMLSSKVEKGPQSNISEIQSRNTVNRHSHGERNFINLKIEKVQNDSERKERLLSEGTEVKMVGRNEKIGGVQELQNKVNFKGVTAKKGPKKGKNQDKSEKMWKVEEKGHRHGEGASST